MDHLFGYTRVFAEYGLNLRKNQSQQAAGTNAVPAPFTRANNPLVFPLSTSFFMQKLLLNLCTEVVDAIVNHIDDPRDVLSAALTCKMLYQVTVYHLEFRHIRCDPRQKDLWDGLCKRPALASKVRFLEIRWTQQDGLVLSDDTSILPHSMGLAPVNSSSSPDKTLDFTSIVTAMEHMDSLIRFSWTGLMPQGIGHILKATDNLLSPLKEFQISLEKRDFDNGSVDLLSQAFPVEQLPSLRALAIAHYWPYGETYSPNPFYEALATDTGLLLQDLLIDFLGWSSWLESSETSFAHFFKTARLYQLKRFTIYGKALHSVKEGLTGFLSHHPKLEALWLGSGPPNIKESKIILPNLKALQFQRFPSSLDEALKHIPEEMYKSLKHLRVFLNDLSLLKNTPLLESCYLQRVSNISQLSTKVPLLQRLDFRPILSENGKGKAKFKIWLKDLSKLTNLTHLSGLFADKHISILDRDVQKHLQGLANKLRNLKHVEVHYEASAWITIDRDSNGDYSGFHDAKLPAYKLKEWGTFFYGYH